MISPENINISELPSVALADRRLLPTDAGIYLAVDHQGAVHYVGQSNNLKRRWQKHHHLDELTVLDGVRIAYVILDVELLKSAEREFIHWFKPPLNAPYADRSPSPQVDNFDDEGWVREVLNSDADWVFCVWDSSYGFDLIGVFSSFDKAVSEAQTHQTVYESDYIHVLATLMNAPADTAKKVAGYSFADGWWPQKLIAEQGAA